MEILERKIVQLIPAGGWVARYAGLPDQVLVCWALVENCYIGAPVKWQVVGMIEDGVDGVIFADKVEDFKFDGYRWHEE